MDQSPLTCWTVGADAIVVNRKLALAAIDRLRHNA
jgi:hypothetical protein